MSDVLDIIDNLSEVPKMYYGAIFGVGFVLYYLIEVVKAPQLVCGDGPFRTFIEENVDLVKNKFWPTLWCFESRAQTVLASVLRSTIMPDIHYRREILTLKDGGEVALDWSDENLSQNSPIVLILPGLTGGSQAEYVKCLVSSAKKIGIKCVIFNNRGLGGVTLKTPRLYCAANSDDLAEVLSHIRKLNPNSPLSATGISMGGMILGNYLAQQGALAVGKIKSALIISAPWNVFEATKSIEKPGLNLMLNKHLADGLRKNLINVDHSNRNHWFDIDIDTVLKSRTIREFDENFTASHFGYKDVDDYYEDATLHNKLHFIQVPTLCLSAADDPFQPFEAIPLKEASKLKNVAFVVTKRGGHIGFLEGFWPMKQEQYIGKLFSQFFKAVFMKELNNHVST